MAHLCMAVITEYKGSVYEQSCAQRDLLVDKESLRILVADAAAGAERPEVLVAYVAMQRCLGVVECKPVYAALYTFVPEQFEVKPCR